jgi:hypothetical protein
MEMNHLNRHERRRARFEHGMKRLHRAAMSTSANNSTWAMNLELLTLEQVLFHRDIRIIRGFVDWAQHIPETRPMCLLCEHSWSSCGQLPPPAGVVVVRPWNDRKHERMVCVVCETCFFHRRTLIEDIKTAMRKLWPDARFSDGNPPSASIS